MRPQTLLMDTCIWYTFQRLRHVKFSFLHFFFSFSFLSSSTISNKLKVHVRMSSLKASFH